MARTPSIDRVIEQAGQTYCEQAGFTLRDTPAPLFQLATLTILRQTHRGRPGGRGVSRAAARGGSHGQGHARTDLAAAGRRPRSSSLPPSRRELGDDSARALGLPHSRAELAKRLAGHDAAGAAAALVRVSLDDSLGERIRG